MLIEKVENLARCNNFQKQRTREAIEIILIANNINRDQRVEISRAWLPNIDSIQEQRRKNDQVLHDVYLN